MKIFNSDTRSVILNHEKAYKFFNSRSECEEEVKRLKKSPISEVYDEISNYKMKIVKILEVKEYFYSMDQAKGEKLEMPTGSTRIDEGDVIALFVLSKDVPEVERLLQVSIDFF